jgi:short-subunit dehydrogenase
LALPQSAPGSTSLITGASSGVGAEIARQLAERGHNTVLVARREDRLRELAQELSDTYGVRAETVGCDLADAASREQMIARVEELGLTVEVLVNNAGYGTGGPFVELPADREIGMVRTNCEAVVHLLAVYAPQMAQRERGAILNTASVAAFQPLPRQATYAATKALVLSLSEALHAELQSVGVTVTALCPGPVRTEFIEVAQVEETLETTPGFVWINADQAARAAIEGLEQGRRVVVPHLPVQAVAIAGRHTPRSVLLRALRRFYPV